MSNRCLANLCLFNHLSILLKFALSAIQKSTVEYLSVLCFLEALRYSTQLTFWGHYSIFLWRAPGTSAWLYLYGQTSSKQWRRILVLARSLKHLPSEWGTGSTALGQRCSSLELGSLLSFMRKHCKEYAGNFQVGKLVSSCKFLPCSLSLRLKFKGSLHLSPKLLRQ